MQNQECARYAFMNSIAELTKQIIKFRDDRDWKQFHSPKNMVLSLLIEAGELAEHFQWRENNEFDELDSGELTKIGEELADVLYWVLLMANDLGLDLEASFHAKMLKNIQKYPPDASRGRRNKYSEI